MQLCLLCLLNELKVAEIMSFAVPLQLMMMLLLLLRLMLMLLMLLLLLLLLLAMLICRHFCCS